VDWTEQQLAELDAYSLPKVRMDRRVRLAVDASERSVDMRAYDRPRVVAIAPWASLGIPILCNPYKEVGRVLD